MEHPKRALCDRSEVVSADSLDYHTELRMPKFAHSIGTTDYLESEHEVLAKHPHTKLLGDDSTQFFTDSKDRLCMVFSCGTEHDIERLTRFLKDCKHKFALEAYQGPEFPDSGRPDEAIRLGHHIRIYKPYVFVVRVDPLHPTVDTPVHDSNDYWKRRE